MTICQHIIIILYTTLALTHNFLRARPCNNIFALLQKRSSCLFVPKRSVKRKKEIDLTRIGLTKNTGILAKVVKDTRQQIKSNIVPGNCVAVILWLYLSVLIVWTRKQFVLFHIQFITILIQPLASQKA